MKIDKNEFFRQATIRICGSLDIDTAMERCFLYIKNFLPVNQMTLDIFDPGLNVINFIASVASEGEKDFGRILSLPEEGRNERAARWSLIEDIEIINRPDSDPDIRKVFQTIGRSLDVSLMFMRLELEGNRVGSLTLLTNGTDRYTDEHARMLLLLHEPFAIAMANALQHQEVLKLKDMLADDNRYLHRQLRELSGGRLLVQTSV